MFKVDTQTSQGLQIDKWHVRKLEHHYTTAANQQNLMYYHKLVVVFKKTAQSAPYFLHVENTMAKFVY